MINFKYSNSELVAYLLTKGYVINNIEVKNNKRYINKYKVFFSIKGKKEELIKIEKEFKNKNTINICMQEYINNLYKVKKIIHEKLNKSKNKEE